MLGIRPFTLDQQKTSNQVIIANFDSLLAANFELAKSIMIEYDQVLAFKVENSMATIFFFFNQR